MILVTGASGLIGRALVRQLLEDGTPVRAQTRQLGNLQAALGSKSDASKQLSIEEIAFDLSESDAKEFDRLVRGCSAVVHLGGLVHQPNAASELYEAVNVRATKLLSAAAARAKVSTFVLMSSSAVYGEGPFLNADEHCQLSAKTPYALSKVDCEAVLSEADNFPRKVILRPGLVFGEGDRGNMLALIKQIRKGLYFHIGGNDAEKSIISSLDLALAIKLCLAAAGPGLSVFNAAYLQPIRVVDLANEIAETLKVPAPHTVPRSLLLSGASLLQTVLGSKSPITVAKLEKLMTTTTLNVERLAIATGFKPTASLKEALRRQISWMES